MSWDEVDENDLLKQAEAGDREAMRELSRRLETRGRALLHESQHWLDRLSRSFPLDRVAVEASLELARFHVSARDYQEATWLLSDRARPVYGLSAEDLVLIHPEALGPRLELGGDGQEDAPERAGVFTVITPYPDRAAATLSRVAPQLRYVDERGEILSDEEDTGEYMTPSFVFDPEVARYGARIAVDTGGAMWAKMGTTIVETIASGLIADAIPAIVTGHCPDLTDFRAIDGSAQAG